MVEQVSIHIRVLVIHDVFDHQVNGSDLVVLKGSINSRLSFFVLVEQRELRLEMSFILLVEK